MLKLLAVHSGPLRPRSYRALAVAALAVGLSGCSADKVLDAVNPVTWYHDIVDDPSKADAQSQANLEAGSKEDYPNLSTVPDEPTQGLTAAERAKLAEGLVADREHARHTDELIRQGDASAVAPPPATLPEEQFKQSASAPSGNTPASDVPTPRTTPQPEAAADAPPTPALKPVPPPEPVVPPASAPAAPPASAPQTASAAPPAPEQVASAPEVQSGAAKTTPNLIGTVVFAQGSNSLSDEASAILAQVPAALFGQPGTLRVVGRATIPETGSDPAGRQMAAYQAALAHAGTVKGALVKSGIPASRITTEAAPAAGPPDAGAADRADIYVQR